MTAKVVKEIETLILEFQNNRNMLLRVRWSILVLIGLFQVMNVVATTSAEPLHVALLGDSNTWIGGDDCSDEHGWSRWFVQCFHPATCYSFARSGATWSHTPRTVKDTKEYTEVISDNNVVLNQLYRLLDSLAKHRTPMPDVVVIAAGTNDAWFADKRPDALQGGVAEAVDKVCSIIRRQMPKARVLLLTPIPSAKISAGRITKVGDIIERSAALAGVECLRLDKVGCIDADKERKKYVMTRDGVHTSTDGARCIGEAVAQYLLTTKIK